MPTICALGTSFIRQFFTSFVIGVEAADVETSGGHRPCVHDGMVHEIVRQITRSIVSAAVLQAMTDEVEIFLHIDIERRHGEV